MMMRFLPLLLALALTSASMVVHPSHAAERPNFLFVFADDWGRYASAYAVADGPGTPSDVVQTPNFDRVATRGVLFRHAFVNAPSCTPCRSSLLTGQYFWRTGRGAILRGAVWDPAIPSYPLLLHEAGYHLGKTHKVWSPGRPADAPYGGTRFAFDDKGQGFNHFSANVAKRVAAGEPLDAAKQKLIDAFQSNFSTCLDARPAGKPFCYWLGPTNVHRKWERGSGKALWGIEPDQLQGKLPPFLPDVPEIREDFADYLGEVQALDALLGAALANLEQRGELENTVIVVSGDHGPPGFTHGKCNLYDFGTAVSLAICGPDIPGGRIVDDFVSLPDLAPTFLELAGVAPPEVMTARSLVPLLHSNASGQVDPERTWVVRGRERHVDTARADLAPYPQRALRTRDYLYVINFRPERWPLGDPYRLDAADEPSAAAITADTHATFPDMDAGPTKSWLVTHRHDPRWRPFYELAFAKRPREELYVLADDPYQMKNVAADPKYADVRARLEEQLLGVLLESGDPRVADDGAYFETPPLGGPGSAEAAAPRARRQQPL